MTKKDNVDNVLLCPLGCRYPILEHGVIQSNRGRQPVPVYSYDDPGVFDLKAEKIITVGQDNPIRPQVFDEILPLLGKVTVVDQGCGSGKEALPVCLALSNGSRYVGIDQSLNMAMATAEMLNKKVDSVPHHVIWGDAAKMPLTAGIADIVIQKHLLNRAENPEGIVKEAHRLLRPGGTLHVQVPSENHYLRMSIPQMGRHFPLPPLTDDIAHPEGRRWTREELTAIAHDHGFTAEISCSPFYHVAPSLGEALRFLSAKGYGETNITPHLWPVIDWPVSVIFKGEYLTMRAVKA